MVSSKKFLKKLQIESQKWISVGIIDETQKNSLLKIYDDEIAAKKNKISIGLPAIIMGLAGVLLCTGIIIFYAANWRSMPPSAKLAQVFLLIILTYAISYYFLIIKNSNILLGRIMLMTGMVSYGAGIALVAQIYHISAHPTNGMLAWAIGAMALSWVMSEKWGFYLAAALFFIWNSWELIEFSNPNYIYIVVPLLFSYLFYKVRGNTGVALMFFAALFWFYQINLHWIGQIHNNDIETSALVLLSLCHIPLGLIIIGVGWILKKNDILSIPAAIITVSGWLALCVPFLTLSWPMKLQSPYLVFQSGTVIHSIELLLLLAGAVAIIYLLFRNKLDVRMHWGGVIFTAVISLLPQGNDTVLLAAMHIGLFVFLFGLLDFYLADPRRKIERFLFYFLFIAFLVIKGNGFRFIAGTLNEEYFIAYGIGFVLYGVVSFLVNHAVLIHAERRGDLFRPNIINAACAFAGYYIIYTLSFKVENQSSILDATPSVLFMLFLFISSAFALYIYLWVHSSRKLLLVLSGMIFFSSSVMLFISGPGVSWIAYSLLFNILLFIITAIFIYYSTCINSRLLLNFAISGFVLHVVTRYFDIFWDLMSGAGLFILTGIIGIAGGWLLEKNRRRLIHNMDQSQGEPGQ